MNKRWLYLDLRRFIHHNSAEMAKVDATLRAKEKSVILEDQAISRVFLFFFGT